MSLSAPSHCLRQLPPPTVFASVGDPALPAWWGPGRWGLSLADQPRGAPALGKLSAAGRGTNGVIILLFFLHAEMFIQAF